VPGVLTALAAPRPERARDFPCRHLSYSGNSSRLPDAPPGQQNSLRCHQLFIGEIHAGEEIPPFFIDCPQTDIAQQSLVPAPVLARLHQAAVPAGWAERRVLILAGPLRYGDDPFAIAHQNARSLWPIS